MLQRKSPRTAGSPASVVRSAILVVLFLWPAGVDDSRSARAQADPGKAECANHLRAFQQFGFVFSRKTNQFPHAKTSLGAFRILLSAERRLTPDVLVCPLKDETPAQKKKDGSFEIKEKNVSYRFVVSGGPIKPTKNAILVYCRHPDGNYLAVSSSGKVVEYEPEEFKRQLAAQGASGELTRDKQLAAAKTIRSLSTALDKYKIDQGEFPACGLKPDPRRNDFPRLWRALMAPPPLGGRGSPYLKLPADLHVSVRDQKKFRRANRRELADDQVDKYLLDPWGRPYVYRCNRGIKQAKWMRNPLGYDLYSAGPNKRNDTSIGIGPPRNDDIHAPGLRK